MKTHILYSISGKNRLYFSGIYNGEIDAEDFPIIDFKWNKNKNKATAMYSPDAWDLLRMCRYSWPHLTIEIERIIETKELIYAL